MKQQGRRGKSEKKRAVGQSPSEFSPIHVNETLVSCVTTRKFDVDSIDEYTACEELTALIESMLVRPCMSNAQTSDPRGEGANCY